MDEFDLFSQFGQPTLPRQLGISNSSNPTSADIARAHQLRAFQNAQRPQARQQSGYYQQSNPRPQQPQQSFPPRNMSMADQYADLTKDPGGMRQQMSGAGNTIGNALRANSQAMTDAGVGPLAPYSEKNPGPYNFMGPAMYGGESADKIAKEKAAMFPGMGGMFGGGGMGMMGGGMGYIPKPEDLQRQIDYMDTMDMVKRRHQQNAAEAFQQNTMQYPAYANMFGTMLNGIFGGNRQQFPTSFSTNYGASGGMTQPPAQQKALGNLQDGYTNRQQPSLLNQVFRRY